MQVSSIRNFIELIDKLEKQNDNDLIIEARHDDNFKQAIIGIKNITEGSAIGHCGNTGSPKSSNQILSLGQIIKHNGTDIIESTVGINRILNILVEIIVFDIPPVINKDSVVYVQNTKDSFYQICNKFSVNSEEKDSIYNILSFIDSIVLRNLERDINNSTLGGVINFNKQIKDEIFINISGLMGNSEQKTKKELLSFVGEKPINKFKSILAHELRHVMQNREYSHNLDKRQNIDAMSSYNYDTDPLEIDASYMESLVDNNIDSFNNVDEYVNAVMNSFVRKKPLSNKNLEHYRRKTAKFYVMVNDKNIEAASLKGRLDIFRKKIITEFLSGFDKSVEEHNNNVMKKFEHDFKKYNGEVDKYPEGLQSDYIILKKLEVIRKILGEAFYGDDKMSTKSMHLTIATIIYANTTLEIPHINRIINKIQTLYSITLEDTISFLLTDGFFSNKLHGRIISESIRKFKS